MNRFVRTLRKGLRLPAAPVLTVVLLLLHGSAIAASFALTNPTSVRKVLPTTGDAGPKAETLRIAMARGEYEPAQLVVHAIGSPLRGVRVAVGGLSGAQGLQGSVLPPDRIVVTPLGYVTCKAPTYGMWTPLLQPEGGEVPDVLLPDRPMDIPRGRRQPYYITVRTLRTDRAGEYRGTVRISADGEKTQEIPLVVRVYDLVLPIKSHLRTAFGLDTSYRKLVDAQPGKDLESLLRYSKVMLEYRVSPCVIGDGCARTGVPARWPEDNVSWDFSGMDRYISELAPLGLTSFYTCGHLSSPYFVDHLRDRGWFDLAYMYMNDEAPMGELAQMRKTYEGRARAGVKVLQVGWNPVKPLEGLVNIWCPLLSRDDTYALHKARERGEETWWYVCNEPKTTDYPNFSFVDHPGIGARITGWMTYHYQIGGLLYYAVDIWDTHRRSAPLGRLSVDDYDRANYANWDPNVSGAKTPVNGCGWLFYPGKGNTPIPSMRLALVRDGFEDYDIFKELEALATGEDQAVVRARRLLDFSSPFDHPIIISQNQWTKDASRLMQRRETILKMAEELR